MQETPYGVFPSLFRYKELAHIPVSIARPSYSSSNLDKLRVLPGTCISTLHPIFSALFNSLGSHSFSNPSIRVELMCETLLVKV